MGSQYLCCITLDIFVNIYYNYKGYFHFYETKGETGLSTQTKTEALRSAKEKLSQTKGHNVLSRLFDDGVFTEIDTFAKSQGDFAEVIAAKGCVNGAPVFAYAQNKDLSGGAMSVAQSAKIKKLYDLALKTGTPVVAVYDSIGGRLSEGTQLLAAYGDILRMSSNLSGVVPQISLVLGPCCGTQALIAVSADIVVMSDKGSLSLATDGSDADVKTNAKNGTAHITAEGEDAAINEVRRLIPLLPSNNLDYAGFPEFDEPDGDAILDGGSEIELQKDYGCAVKTFLGTIEGTTVGIVATADKTLDGKACSKAARFVRFCDAFGLPVITLVDAEKFGCLKAAAKLTSAYAEATTAKITAIVGDAYGAVYTAVAGTGAAADITLATVDACVSPLAPEAAAVIALGDDFGGALKGAKDPKAARAEVVAKFKEEKLSAMNAAANGYVEDIVEDSELRAKIAAAVAMLSDKRVSTLPKKHNNLYI